MNHKHTCIKKYLLDFHKLKHYLTKIHHRVFSRGMRFLFYMQRIELAHNSSNIESSRYFVWLTHMQWEMNIIWYLSLHFRLAKHRLTLHLLTLLNRPNKTTWRKWSWDYVYAFTLFPKKFSGLILFKPVSL